MSPEHSNEPSPPVAHRQLPSRVHRARDGLVVELAARPQGDQRLAGVIAVGVLERLLHGAQL
jgi:hypothetical protein